MRWITPQAAELADGEQRCLVSGICPIDPPTGQNEREGPYARCATQSVHGRIPARAAARPVKGTTALLRAAKVSWDCYRYQREL